MLATIEEMPGQRVAYMRQVGPYGPQNGQLMERLKAWAASHQLFHAETLLFGIAHDNPETTLPENCRYDVCLVLPDAYIIDEDHVQETSLPGGLYAVFTIPHTAEAMQKAWAEGLPALLAQGHRIDITRPIFERYRPRMLQQHLCELCVPIL